MEDIVPLVFFAVAWILAAVGNQRKRQKRRGQQNLPDTEFARRPTRTADREGAPDLDSAGRARDLIPGDLWEEIQALARGQRPRSADPSPPLPELPRDVRARTGAPVQRVPQPLPPPDALPEAISLETLTPRALPSVTERPVRALAEVRALPEVRRLSVAHTRPSRRDRAAELGLGDPSAARKAMILREVLGPPLALREPGPEQGQTR